MKRVTFGKLRTCSIPDPKPDESDLITSLRRTCQSEHHDRMSVNVPDEMYALIPRHENKATQNLKPTEPKPDTAEGPSEPKPIHYR